MQSNVEFKQQLTSRGIPVGVAAALASTGKMRIFPTDLSYFFAGRTIAEGKNDALRKACETLIDLSDSLRVQPNWKNLENVRHAIQLLAEARQQQASAPWQSFHAAATPEDAIVSSASAILSETK
jgi:hypothetical protein